jgi:anti-anti-sigma factor
MTSILYHSIAENNKDVSILYFNKDMDERMTDKFRQYINGLLVEQSFRRIVIFQLENTKYINNIGLNFLIEMKELFMNSGKKLFLCSVGAQVSTYLRTLGYDSFFYIGADTSSILEHIRLNKL